MDHQQHQQQHQHFQQSIFQRSRRIRAYVMALNNPDYVMLPNGRFLLRAPGYRLVDGEVIQEVFSTTPP